MISIAVMEKCHSGFHNATEQGQVSPCSFCLTVRTSLTGFPFFAVISAVTALWEYWQPTIIYSSLQVAVTSAKVLLLSWQHGIKGAQVRWLLSVAETFIAPLYFTGFFPPSTLPSLFSLVSTYLS